MNRRTLLFIGLACAIATPVAAQEGMGQAYTFLKAVRDRDGNMAQVELSNPSSTAINARDGGGTGALHIVVARRDADWLGWLLANRARANLQDGEGNTPLALAAQLGWTEGASLLLARGADANLANRRGETPLILAVQARQLRAAMVRLLLERGADPRRQDSAAGYSAIDYARRDGRSADLVQLMETARPARREMVGPSLN